MSKSALGVTLPLQKGANGYFETTTDVATQLRSNLTNLLLTKKGQRMMQPTFGCDIHSVIFEPQTDNNVSNVKASIESAIRDWMPFIAVDSVKITRDTDHNRMLVRMVFHLITNQAITDSIILVF